MKVENEEKRFMDITPEMMKKWSERFTKLPPKPTVAGKIESAIEHEIPIEILVELKSLNPNNMYAIHTDKNTTEYIRSYFIHLRNEGKLKYSIVYISDYIDDGLKSKLEVRNIKIKEKITLEVIEEFDFIIIDKYMSSEELDLIERRSKRRKRVGFTNNIITTKEVVEGIPCLSNISDIILDRIINFEQNIIEEKDDYIEVKETIQELQTEEIKRLKDSEKEVLDETQTEEIKEELKEKELKEKELKEELKEKELKEKELQTIQTEELDKIKEEYNKLNRELNIKNKDIEKYKSELDIKQKMIENLKEDSKKNKKTIENKNIEIQELSDCIKEMNIKISTRDDRIKIYEEEIERIEIKLKEKEDIIKELQKDKEEMELKSSSYDLIKARLDESKKDIIEETLNITVLNNVIKFNVINDIKYFNSILKYLRITLINRGKRVITVVRNKTNKYTHCLWHDWIDVKDIVTDVDLVNYDHKVIIGDTTKIDIINLERVIKKYDILIYADMECDNMVNIQGNMIHEIFVVKDNRTASMMGITGDKITMEEDSLVDTRYDEKLAKIKNSVVKAKHYETKLHKILDRL